MTLKNNATTEDDRLDRVYPGVEAHLPSLAYLITDTPLAQKPFRSRTWPLKVWLDQGKEGRCVEFGLSHELAAIPFRISDTVINDILAERKIYWPAQRRDNWAGGSYPGASPVYEGTSVLAGAGVCKEYGFYSEYRWAMNVEELARAVAYQGPAVLGVNWYQGFFDPGADGFIRIGTLGVAGGHCICCIGVRVVKNKDGAPDYDKSYFILQNSWGKDWGQNGRCKISWTDTARLISEEGEVLLPTIRNQVKTPVTTLTA